MWCSDLKASRSHAIRELFRVGKTPLGFKISISNCLFRELFLKRHTQKADKKTLQHFSTRSTRKNDEEEKRHGKHEASERKILKKKVSYTLSTNEKYKKQTHKKRWWWENLCQRNFSHSLLLWGKFKKQPKWGKMKNSTYRLHYNISVYWFLDSRCSPLIGCPEKLDLKFAPKDLLTACS